MKNLAIYSTLLCGLFFKTASALVSPYIGAGGALSFDTKKPTESAKKINPSFNVNAGVELNAVIAKFGFEGFYEKGFKSSDVPTFYGVKGKLFLINLIVLEPYIFGGFGGFKYNNLNNNTFVSGGLGINSNLSFIKLFAELGFVSAIKSNADFRKINLVVGARYYFF